MSEARKYTLLVSWAKGLHDAKLLDALHAVTTRSFCA